MTVAYENFLILQVQLKETSDFSSLGSILAFIYLENNHL